MADIENSQLINGIKIITPQIFGDERGMFVETFRQEWLREDAPTMVQGNRATKAVPNGTYQKSSWCK